jgi:hypothetical protein
MRVPNTMGMPSNYLGSNGMGFNQYLDSPPDVATSLETLVWRDGILTVYTPKFGQGIYDHMHYMIRYDGVVPTLSEMAQSYTWQEDFLVLNLPEASGIMVYMIAHDHFHRTKEGGQDLLGLGEYWVDYTAPSGVLHVNNGAPQSMEQVVDLHVLAHDALSGMSEMYISGDVQGVNVNQWIHYAEHTDILVSDREGQQTIVVKLKDHAGNISNVFYASIIYPLVRYFFHKTTNTTMNLVESRKTMTVLTHDLKQSENVMEEATPNGNFRAT